MNCPSCSTQLEPNARFCGVCGFKIDAPPAASAGSAPVRAASGSAAPAPRLASPSTSPAPQPVVRPPLSAQKAQQTPRPVPKSRAKLGDEMYIGQTLNNRFQVESKIGEGGFGAVYRGTQLATNRKVALKLLHPEMTKDENLVARFRREGMVLCNLRDAHTITTYDFDQTPDGTLYIAMELLEGKSLHQVFHEQQPLEWKRVFKILGEMCSSLAEAHAQGIVHRDLKPENIYLETRPGNPEFVKILDFGIAKVMRGDSIDPQSPQLTATGQTLGTLEYMSPEQLMGKPLDGRSDVYALGVVAYEMITGRLPFPDAKGPAGLITAQLKQTPIAPSLALPTANLPPTADRLILKALEKDKNNRFADVSAMAEALLEVVATIASDAGQSQSRARAASAALIETQRGDPLNLPPPPNMPPNQNAQRGPDGPRPLPGMGPANQVAMGSAPVGAQPSSPMPLPSPPMTPMPGTWPGPQQGMPGPGLAPGPLMMQSQPMTAGANMGHPMAMAMGTAGAPQGYAQPGYPQQGQQMPQGMAPPQAMALAGPAPAGGSNKWIWWVVGLLALGAAAGAVLALVMR